MRLSHYKDLIEAETSAGIQSIASRPAHGPEGGLSLQALLLRFEPDEPVHRAATDTAVGFWAEHRKWQRIEPVVAEYALLRLNSAVRFLESVDGLDLEASQPESQILHWLLVDHWRIDGRRLWLYRNSHPEEPDP